MQDLNIISECKNIKISKHPINIQVCHWKYKKSSMYYKTHIYNNNYVFIYKILLKKTNLNSGHCTHLILIQSVYIHFSYEQYQHSLCAMLIKNIWWPKHQSDLKLCNASHSYTMLIWQTFQDKKKKAFFHTTFKPKTYDGSIHFYWFDMEIFSQGYTNIQMTLTTPNQVEKKHNLTPSQNL